MGEDDCHSLLLPSPSFLARGIWDSIQTPESRPAVKPRMYSMQGAGKVVKMLLHCTVTLDVLATHPNFSASSGAY